MPTQIKPSPSATEVLRYIKEEALILKIKDSGLLQLDGDIEAEYCNSLFDLFVMYQQEADISDWETFTKKILHNAPKDAREELKYISFELFEEESDNDFDMYEETRVLTIQGGFVR